MRRRTYTALAIGLILTSDKTVTGQILRTEVDILSPGDEGYDGIPPSLAVIDIFVDIATTDAWTAAGIRLLAQNGATIEYFDGEPNTPGEQPGLINPGVENRFLTSLSRPRARNGAGRFQNAGAAIGSSYDSGGGFPSTLPNLLDVACFANPPITSGSPSIDGWIARIAVDISQTGYGAKELVVVRSPQENAILACEGNNQPWGFVNATYDVPALNGFSFWVVPEPASLASLAIAQGTFGRLLRASSRLEPTQ